MLYQLSYYRIILFASAKVRRLFEVNKFLCKKSTNLYHNNDFIISSNSAL